MLRKERGYTKIGTVGYCYGGTVSAFLGKSPELVNTVVVAHAGHITDDVCRAIKVPASWACAEGKLSFPVLSFQCTFYRYFQRT